MKKRVFRLLKVLRPPYSSSAHRLFILGAAALLLGLFIKLTSELREGEIDALDQAVLTRILALRVDAFNGPAVDLTALGSPTVLTLFTVLGLLFFWLKRNGRDAGHLAVGCMGIPFWSTFMKHLLSRPRPVRVQHLVDVTSFSYPSGHTVAATSFYLLIAFLISRQFSSVRARAVILALALGLIAAIGFSRLYLGVHYPSDVLSGFLLGSAWVLFLTAFYSLRNPDSPTRL